MKRALSCAVLAAAVAGCGGTLATPTGDAGADGAAPGDTSSTGEAGGDGLATPCDTSAMGDACCCDGDIQRRPVCNPDGSLTCASAFHLYSGADCTRSGGPCTLPPWDASATDSPAEAATCDADATAAACCCAGDVHATPVCGANGSLTCPSGLDLYHGAECDCPLGAGPCCLLPPVPDTGVPDAPDTGVTDGPADAMTCAEDALSTACCCDGDVVTTPVCDANGSLTCTYPYQLYRGTDCTRANGPCMLPGPDAWGPDE
jgi:hypothetical protein